MAVGEQTGGLPSGAGKNIGLSERHSVGQQLHPAGWGRTSHWAAPPVAEQSTGRPAVPSGKKHSSKGQMLITSAQSEGIGLGAGVGSGLGIAVGEQTGGLPSGDGLNIGLSGVHSSGQQLQPLGCGNMSHLAPSPPPTAEQLVGRFESLRGKKQSSKGQMLITSAQSEGAALGDSEGMTAGAAKVGAGEGIVVGEQAGGLPSGDGLNMGFSGVHSSGQQEHPTPVGWGNMLH
mmetsp:Transcript_36107/g.87293  ORF Transcript_36107/g.87293 Transcript_36107/m.87293 type:complete len:232 (-) Transcript_36107:568-1263(-)